MFLKLYEVSKLMEAEKFILASSYWGALHEIEVAISHHAEDSKEIAAVRAAMNADHFHSRVTLEESIEIPLHVLMHLSDPRHAQPISSLSACLIFIFYR